MRYQEIAEELRRRIGAGELIPGRLLPSEAELGAAYATSRITVRKALEVLRNEGLVESRQGLGWFVPADPLQQSLGRLATIESQLVERGITSTRQILDFRFVAAPTEVRKALGARRVLEVRRLHLADGEPFARVTVWCPEALGKRLSLEDVERRPFYELLDDTLGGATQTIAAGAASAGDSELLRVPLGSPVLLCRRTTNDVDGKPVLMSEHVFPGHRTEFVVDLPRAERSIAPIGLRLAELRLVE